MKISRPVKVSGRRVIQAGKISKEILPYKSWWLSDKQELFRHMQAAVDNIGSTDYRRRKNIRNAILYSPEHRGTLEYSAGYQGHIPPYNSGRSSFNVVKSNVNTITSKMSKNKPKILFLTDGGSYAERQRGKLLTKYVSGVFSDMKIYRKGIKNFKNAAIFGTGAIKIIQNTEQKKIEVETVLTDEIIVDDADGQYGTPKCLYQRTYISRSSLTDLYPQFQSEINEASTQGYRSTDSSVDMIEVTEGWRLPFKNDKGELQDGVHAICIESATLFYEEWKKEYFPFYFLRWNDAVTGFYGESLVDELVDLQQLINITLNNINEALERIGKPRMWLPEGCNVSPSLIQGYIGQILAYSGNKKPDFETPIAMNSETYNHLYWYIKSAYEISGVSQMSATGKKESGVNAAVAMRTMQDIESERFLEVSTAYENMYLDLAEMIVDQTCDLYEKTGNLSVKVEGENDELEFVDWKDCRLEKSRYVMKLWPVNLLPDKPEGKLQTVSELMQAGLIDQVSGQRLLNYPDLAAYNQQKFAPFKLIDKIIHEIISKGRYTPPEPYMDLEYSIQAAQNAYSEGRLSGAPDKNLNLVLRFMAEVERLAELMVEENAQNQPAVPAEQQVVPEQNPAGMVPVA